LTAFTRSLTAGFDWQADSVRGFLSTAAKKRGLKIESTKTKAGDRLVDARQPSDPSLHARLFAVLIA
jgi:hypothetical protein